MLSRFCASINYVKFIVITNLTIARTTKDQIKMEKVISLKDKINVEFKSVEDKSKFNKSIKDKCKNILKCNEKKKINPQVILIEIPKNLIENESDEDIVSNIIIQNEDILSENDNANIN